MQTHIYDIAAPKKPVNLRTVKSRLEQKWLQENKRAIEEYNAHIEEHGM